MKPVTFLDVRTGLLKALAQAFPDIDRYGEEIKQGLEAPCFFVKLFPVSQEREFGRRYKRFHSFDIHYFPKSETRPNEESHALAEQLYDQLEYIEVNNGLCRGTKMKHEIVDEVLHFFVTYDFHVLRSKTAVPKMQTLEQEEYIK